MCEGHRGKRWTFWPHTVSMVRPFFSMAKPRNYHALNAIQRRAGFHSGKRRPHLSESDDVSERWMDAVEVRQTSRGVIVLRDVPIPCTSCHGEFEV